MSPLPNLPTPMSAKERHLRRAMLLFLVTAILASIAPVLRPLGVDAAPSGTRVTFSGWNVGATPRICDVDTVLASTTCASLPITDASPDATSGMAAGDLNADGLIDLAISNESGGVNACLDDGSGGWTCSSYSTTARHSGIVIADVSGDGSPDIVAVNETAANMKVCLNSGTGTFTCTTQTTPNWTTGVAALDVDGDLDNDLVIAGNGSGAYSCINDGSAAFTCSVFGNGVPDARAVHAGELDGDGYPDLVFALTPGDEFVCFGGAGGTFACSSIHIGGNTFGADIGDFDGDGIPDVAFANDGTPYRLCLNDGARNFTCSDLAIPTGNGRDIEIGDVDGDGNADLAVSVLGVNMICPGNGAADVTGCTTVDTGQNFNSLGVAILQGEPAVLDTWAGLPALRYGTGPNTLVFLDSGNADALADFQSWVGSNPPIQDTSLYFVRDLTNLADVETAIAPGATAWVGSYVFGQTYGGGVTTNIWYLRGGGVGATGTFRTPGLGNVIQWDTGTEFMTAVVSNYLSTYLAPDADGDGITDASDNCPAVANPGQEDFDTDGLGDVCDPDDDGDSLLDTAETGIHGTDPFNPDTDADVLTDGDEVNVYGTDPTLADTDLDALDDGDEVNVYGTDATLADTDLDALDDGDEVNVYGTDPTLADTDADSLSDGDEINVHLSDPHSTDTDADTLTDGDEVNVHGTDPTLIDTDADGLTDGDEVQTHGTDPNSTDTDGDGYDDFFEVQNGWDAVGLPQPQTISLAVLSTWAGSDGDLDAMADATSLLPVTLTVSGPCSVSGPTITPTGPGTCSITGDQAGNGNWLAAATANASVEFVTSTQTVSVSAPTSLTVGEMGTVTATSDSGLVPTVSVAGPCSATGSTITATGVGTCTVSADQAGDTWFETAPTSTAVVTMNPVPTTTTTTVPPTTTTTTVPPTTVPPTTTTTVAPTTATTVAPTTVTPTTTTVAPSAVAAPTTAAPSPGSTSSDTTTSTSTTTSSTTTTTTTGPALPALDEDSALVETTVDDLLVDGLPQQTGTSLRMVIAGLESETEGFIRDTDQSVDAIGADDGALVIDVDSEFHLAEATLVIEHPDGSITRITSADEFNEGGVLLALDFEVTEGEEVAEATVRVKGEGFLGGSAVALSLHSTPRHLTDLAADADGAFDAIVSLPVDVEPGEHRVLATGETADGPINGEWHFSVDPEGELARVGDPEPGAAVVTPEGDPLPAAPTAIAAAPIAAESAIDPEQGSAQVADADVETGLVSDVDTPVDTRTGLPVYSPVDEPEEVVAEAVEAFALITLLGASTSLLAAGMASTTSMTGLASAGGLGGPTAPSGPRSGSSGSGSSGGSSSGGDDRRGKGKVAGGKASKFGDTIEGSARGDVSRTWRWPLTTRLDRAGTELPARIHTFSPLAARIIADGSTNRAVFGAGSLLLPILGGILGVLAAVGTGGLPVAPAIGLMMAMMVLGILDVSAGFVAAAAFGITVALSGGITGADSIRAILGLSGLWFAIALIAGSVRAFRRGPAEDWAGRWTAFADIVMGSLLAAWTASGVTSSLPALSGLDMPISQQADRVALVAIAALAARYGFERLAVRWYPERLIAVTFEPEDKPGKTQQVVSVLVKASMFAFVVIPYIGVGWELAVVVALTIGPSIAKIWKNAFPNSGRLYRVLPRGVPNTLIMITIGTVLGGSLAARIDDPETLLAVSFVVLAIPGFTLSVLGLIGRDGANPQSSWPLRLAGVWVAAVAILKIRGFLGDSPWLPLAALAPLGVWWLVVSPRAAAIAAAEAEAEVDLPGEDDPTVDGGAEAGAQEVDPADDPFYDEVLTLAGLDELASAEASVITEADEIVRAGAQEKDVRLERPSSVSRSDRSNEPS